MKLVIVTVLLLMVGLFAPVSASTQGDGYSINGTVKNCTAPWQVVVTARSIGNTYLGVAPGFGKEFHNVVYTTRTYWNPPKRGVKFFFWEARNLDYPQSGWIAWARGRCLLRA